ncbi:MAG: IS6 family transposase, partial [Bryobacteraceae bacterium]
LPTDIVFEIVLCRLRYKLSLRNLAEMFLLRGFEFTHEAVRDWEERFAPLLAEHIRRKRKGKMGRRWYVDETYVRVKGKWCYLYRAIDREGNLVDSMLSGTRDMDAAECFFRSARSMSNVGQWSNDAIFRYGKIVWYGASSRTYNQDKCRRASEAFHWCLNLWSCPVLPILASQQRA